MTVETDVARALERVQAEQEWTDEKQAAFERFADAVESIEPGRNRPSTATLGTTTAVRNTAPGRGASVTAVLDAFEEHLAPYSGDSTDAHDSVHEAVAAEFSADIAVALCGGDSAGVLTPELKEVVHSDTSRRLDELGVMQRALDREVDSLRAVDTGISAVCEWFVEHNPTPLSELGFDELRAWHDRIEVHRASLSDIAANRQEFVRSSTGGPEAVGIKQRVLVEYLYTDFEATYPALATIARLEETCREAQRTIRGHLTRRV